MFTTPRKSYRGNNSRTPTSSKVRLDGFFEDGQWFCNCDPRLPAPRLQVKKNGKNKHRWFYTCQKQRKDQCGFFIFEDSAQVREKGELLRTPGPEPSTASRAPPTETPGPAPVRRLLFNGAPQGRGRGPSLSTELSTDDELDMASLADQVSQQGRAGRAGTLDSQDNSNNSTRLRQAAPEHIAAAIPSAKRKLSAFGEDNDTDFGGDFSSDEERLMLRLADESAESQKDSQAPAVESQAGRASFTTPSAPRTHDMLGGLPTPLTRNSLLIVSEAKRQRTAAASPTPTRISQQDSSGGHGDDYDITEEVINILRETPMTESVRQGVRESLNRYALRMRGVERGREMARTTIKAKDGRIAELQARVAALENERKVNRERIRALNTGLKSLYQDDLQET